MRNLLAVVTVAALQFLWPGKPNRGVASWQRAGRRGLDRDTDVTNVLHFRTMGTGSTRRRPVPAPPFSGSPTAWRRGTTRSVRLLRRPGPRITRTRPACSSGARSIGPQSAVSYFVVREDGQFLIKKRMGSEIPTLVDWTEHAAVNTLDAQGRSTNTLTVEVGSDLVHFLANGTEVRTLPRSAVDTDGIVGLRINHLLDVHVDSLKLGM